jgi:hypothetical protein
MKAYPRGLPLRTPDLWNRKSSLEILPNFENRATKANLLRRKESLKAWAWFGCIHILISQASGDLAYSSTAGERLPTYRRESDVDVALFPEAGICAGSIFAAWVFVLKLNKLDISWSWMGCWYYKMFSGLTQGVGGSPGGVRETLGWP